MNTETQIQLLQTAITHSSAEIVILCDASGSMGAHIDSSDATSPTRREVLRQCLMTLAHTLQEGARIYRFAGDVKPFEKFNDPEFQGWDLEFGTNIDMALRVARKHNPSRIILITDGSPTESTPEETVETAQSIFARIDTYFCGAHTDTRATDLCRELAQYGGECFIDPWDAAYSLNTILVHLLLVIQRYGWRIDQTRANAIVARLKALMPCIPHNGSSK